MSKNEIQYLIHFKTQMLHFLDELIQLFPNEPSFIIIRIFVNDKIPVKDVIGRFMKECLPVTRSVKERNDKFFVYSDFIYEKYVGDVGTENMSNFRSVWDSEYLDDDDKGAIWDWIELFISICTKYHTTFGCVEDWEFDLEAEIKNVETLTKKYESTENN